MFGAPLEGITYTDRPAAYAVVYGENGTVAAVRAMSGMIALPGGGCLPGEAADETLVREVREELARSIQIICRIGEATQFFYAAQENCHYKAMAVFFLADFPDQPSGQGEHELFWLPLADAERAFFHASHAWAVRQGLETSGPNAKRLQK
jgi:8-oxo-dGTP pyrophosphatase MutT (NUDIX family)